MPQKRFPALQIDPVAVAVLLALLFTERVETVCALCLAICAHEAGHLLAARLLKIRVEKLRFGLLGARIGVAGLQSYKQEALLAVAGPAASLVCAAVAFPLRSVGFFGSFCALSLILGGLNLLPVQTFDGGRIVSCLFALRFGEAFSMRVFRWLSFGFLTLLWCFSVYLLLRAGSGVSWLGFSATLLARFFEVDSGSFG